MKWKLRALIALIVIMAIIPAWGMAVAAVPAAELDAVIDGQTADLDMSCNWLTTGTGPAQECTLKSPYKTDEFEIDSFTWSSKAEPYISYGIAVMDTGAPSSFSFTFTQLMSPSLLCLEGSSSMSGSTTDGASDGVTITAVPPAGGVVDSDGITEVQVTTVTDGSAVQNIGHDLGPDMVLPTGSAIYGPFNEGYGPVLSSTTGWNNMKTEVTFQLSGNGDILTINGRSDIRQVTCSQVPEFPVPFFPVAGIIGLVCLMMLVRLRK